MDYFNNQNFTNIIVIFVLFSLSGYVLEVVYRSLKSKKLNNPGFLKGPYLPVYGFSAVIVYSLWLLLNSNTILWGMRLFIYVIFVAAFEFLVGYITQKKYKIKLWDYSDVRFNIMGIISPTFALYWLIMIIVSVYIIFPFTMINSVQAFFNNIRIPFFIITGCILFDLILSNFNFLYRIRVQKDVRFIFKNSDAVIDT